MATVRLLELRRLKQRRPRTIKLATQKQKTSSERNIKEKGPAAITVLLVIAHHCFYSPSKSLKFVRFFFVPFKFSSHLVYVLYWIKLYQAYE